MDSDWDGYFVGPTDEASMDAALNLVGAANVDVVDDVGIGTWATTFQRLPAQALAAVLGDGVWLFEVHLQNDFNDDGDDELMETHSGTLRGQRWSAKDNEFGDVVEDEICEEGFIRGGVMRDVALEYAQYVARIEDEADKDRPPLVNQPSRVVAPQFRRPRETLASILLQKLVERGDLELASDDALRSLAWRVERGLDFASSSRAAARILETLDDAKEVDEAYIDEPGLAQLIDELRATQT